MSNVPVQFLDPLDMVPDWEPVGLLGNLVDVLVQLFSRVHMEHSEEVEDDALVKQGLVFTSCEVVFCTVDVGVGVRLSLLFHDLLPSSLLIFSQKVIVKLESLLCSNSRFLVCKIEGFSGLVIGTLCFYRASSMSSSPSLTVGFLGMFKKASTRYPSSSDVGSHVGSTLR